MLDDSPTPAGILRDLHRRRTRTGAHPPDEHHPDTLWLPALVPENTPSQTHHRRSATFHPAKPRDVSQLRRWTVRPRSPSPGRPAPWSTPPCPHPNNLTFTRLARPRHRPGSSPKTRPDSPNATYRPTTAAEPGVRLPSRQYRDWTNALDVSGARYLLRGGEFLLSTSEVRCPPATLRTCKRTCSKPIAVSMTSNQKWAITAESCCHEWRQVSTKRRTKPIAR